MIDFVPAETQNYVNGLLTIISCDFSDIMFFRLLPALACEINSIQKNSQ